MLKNFINKIFVFSKQKQYIRFIENSIKILLLFKMKINKFNEFFGKK